MAQTPDTTSAALWVVLARAYHSMAAFVEQSVSALGLGLSDFMILEALLHKGPMTMSALCDAALIANASMTAAIDRLEEKKFLERVAHPTDRRVRLVQLTAEGHALIKRLYPRHERDLDELMSMLSHAERAELRRTLKLLGLTAKIAAARGATTTRAQ